MRKGLRPFYSHRPTSCPLLGPEGPPLRKGLRRTRSDRFHRIPGSRRTALAQGIETELLCHRVRLVNSPEGPPLRKGLRLPHRASRAGIRSRRTALAQGIETYLQTPAYDTVCPEGPPLRKGLRPCAAGIAVREVYQSRRTALAQGIETGCSLRPQASILSRRTALAQGIETECLCDPVVERFVPKDRPCARD